MARAGSVGNDGRESMAGAGSVGNDGREGMAETGSVGIRSMHSEDTLAVSLLEQEIFTQPWSRQGFLNALTEENLFLVVEQEGKIVGYCGMYCGADEGEIVNVSVKREARGCGIGYRMLKKLLAKAKEAGIRQVVLEVRVSNRAAIGLYEKLGFSIVGLRKGFYEQPREDAYVMMLKDPG